MAFAIFNKKPTSTLSSSSTPTPIFILNLVLRFLQFVFAIAVIGLYAQDLNKAHKEAKYTDSKWAYAVAVASLSAFTALVYMIPKLKFWYACGWDTILFVLWAAVFGIFGKLYIHANAQGDGGIKRMKSAVWVDLVNLLLWLVTAVMGVVLFFTLRGGRSLHTGRAAV
jgi:H+/Cl- antiporter ClcA